MSKVANQNNQVENLDIVKRKKKNSNPLKKYYPKAAPSHRYISYTLERFFPGNKFKISKDYLKNFRQFFYLFSEERLSPIISHNNTIKKMTLEARDIKIFNQSHLDDIKYLMPSKGGNHIEDIHREFPAGFNYQNIEGPRDLEVTNSLYTLPQFKKFAKILGARRISAKSHEKYLDMMCQVSDFVIVNSVLNMAGTSRVTLFSSDILSFLNRSPSFRFICDPLLGTYNTKARALF